MWTYRNLNIAHKVLSSKGYSKLTNFWFSNGETFIKLSHVHYGRFEETLFEKKDTPLNIVNKIGG